MDLATRLVTPILARENASSFLFGSTRNKDLITYSVVDERSEGKGFQFLLARFDRTRVSEQQPSVNVTRSNGFLFSRDGSKVYFTPYAKDLTETNNGEMSEKDLVSGKISKITTSTLIRS